MNPVLDWINQMKLLDVSPAIVIWGAPLTAADAVLFLQAGARGTVRKTADLSVLLACLLTVAGGQRWMEDSLFRDSMRAERYPKSELTAREQQVHGLVNQGLKSKEIALELGHGPRGIQTARWTGQEPGGETFGCFNAGQQPAHPGGSQGDGPVVQPLVEVVPVVVAEFRERCKIAA